MDFSWHHWAAWAPGLTTPAAWVRWLARPHPLSGEDSPQLSWVPTTMRRRLDRLGRMAVQAAAECRASSPPCPQVFASRHGEFRRLTTLLEQVARAEPPSPTSFSLSVHNAIAGLHSIVCDDTAPYSVVTAGAETVEAAFVEACGLLADEAEEVQVVIFDEPLPTPFQHLESPTSLPHAWACRLRADGSTRRYSLTCRPSEDSPPVGVDEGLPSGLAVLRFLVSGEDRLERQLGPRIWSWSKRT